MENFRIEAGQTWLTRGGMIIPITAIVKENGSFPVKSKEMYWMANGKYWSDDLEHSKDLVELITK